MKFLWASFLLLLVVTGCRKDPLAHLEGDYKGSFQRQVPGSGIPLRSHVSLHFSQNHYSGSSDINRYPALCQGQYEFEGSELHITSSCFYTADFDWTLIFNGSYQYQFEGSTLRLWKDLPNGTRDLYSLERQ
jgi:hypothetical protein